ncbi:MAG: hypothetical protein V3W50_07030 [Thermoanaerobaculia bacterium]
MFTQEEANPLHFFLVAIVIGIASAVFFAKTRRGAPCRCALFHWARGLGL